VEESGMKCGVMSCVHGGHHPPPPSSGLCFNVMHVHLLHSVSY
jgi:hypothetical protein